MKLPFEIKLIGDRVKGKGLAVFATENIKEGQILEACPVLTLTPTERKHAEKTVLNYYIYPWKSTRSASVVFGYGSIYNHSFHPNADWKQNFKTNRMVYRAIRDIKKGEEITINYNGEPDDMSTENLWFDVVE
ncbi:MAG TPA: SET domain-containing protein [Patescibacteria group bacterium]|nr:SET domain-containing protein [Patescibacteria group bacterium]